MKTEFPSPRFQFLSMMFAMFIFGFMFGYGFGAGGTVKELFGLVEIFINPANLVSGLVLVTITYWILTRKRVMSWFNSIANKGG